MKQKAATEEFELVITKPKSENLLEAARQFNEMRRLAKEQSVDNDEQEINAKLDRLVAS